MALARNTVSKKEIKDNPNSLPNGIITAPFVNGNAEIIRSNFVVLGTYTLQALDLSRIIRIPSNVTTDFDITLPQNFIGPSARKFVVINESDAVVRIVINGTLTLNYTTDPFVLTKNTLFDIYRVSILSYVVTNTPQSGGATPQRIFKGFITTAEPKVMAETDLFIIGATYWIQTYNNEDDFSNIGGTNASDTYFVATGTTPNANTKSDVQQIPIPYVSRTVTNTTNGNIIFDTNQSIPYLMIGNETLESQSLKLYIGKKEGIDSIDFEPFIVFIDTNQVYYGVRDLTTNTNVTPTNFNNNYLEIEIC